MEASPHVLVVDDHREIREPQRGRLKTFGALVAERLEKTDAVMEEIGALRGGLPSEMRRAEQRRRTMLDEGMTGLGDRIKPDQSMDVLGRFEWERRAGNGPNMTAKSVPHRIRERSSNTCRQVTNRNRRNVPRDRGERRFRDEVLHDALEARIGSLARREHLRDGSHAPPKTLLTLPGTGPGSSSAKLHPAYARVGVRTAPDHGSTRESGLERALRSRGAR